MIKKGAIKGPTRVSKLDIARLKDTSPFAIKVFRFADVPLGTMPAIMIPYDSSDIPKNNTASPIEIKGAITHFPKEPDSGRTGLRASFSKRYLSRVRPIINRIRARAHSVVDPKKRKTSGTHKARTADITIQIGIKRAIIKVKIFIDYF